MERYDGFRARVQVGISELKEPKDEPEDIVETPDLRPLTNYEKATDELHEAARHFVTEWIKAPRESSFDVWFKACERLELAAVEYANAKAQEISTGGAMNLPTDEPLGGPNAQHTYEPS